MVKDKLMPELKNTVKLGIGSMAGIGALGSMANIPGMPSQAGQVTQITGSSLALLNVGQMVKNTKVLTNTLNSKKTKHKGPIGKIIG